MYSKIISGFLAFPKMITIWAYSYIDLFIKIRASHNMCIAVSEISITLIKANFTATAKKTPEKSK